MTDKLIRVTIALADAAVAAVISYRHAYGRVWSFVSGTGLVAAALSFILCGTWFILGGMKERPIDDAEALEAIVDEVEGGGGPVALVRPGHRPVVLVSAEEWQRLDELESAESTAWWRRDAAERRATVGEVVREGEAEQGLDEGEFRRRFAYLFRNTGAA